MTAVRANTIDNGASPYHVLAWWDLDMQIGVYKKRKLTARPLRNLERILGHRVHTEAHMHYPGMPKDVWKLEAYNYLDVSDPAVAAAFVLRQISGVAEWFSGFGYRQVQETSDDLNQDTICTFYWSGPDQPETYRHINSGGVMLVLASKSRSPRLKYSRWELGGANKQNARPIVAVNRPAKAQSLYQVKLVIQFSCKNRQKLTTLHWPKLKERYGFTDDDHIDFGKPPAGNEPNLITAIVILNDVSEHEAIAYCMARTERCRFRLGDADGIVFQAERFPEHGPYDGTFSIELTRMTHT